MEAPLSNYEIAKKLMEYTGKVAWPTITMFLICFSLYTIFIVLGMLDFMPLWLVCVVNTVLAYLLFTPLHEAGHKNISGKKGEYRMLEELIGWCSGLALMAPYPIVRYLHNEHHKHTNHPEKDPDYWVASRNYFVLFLKCMTIYFDYVYQYFRKTKLLWQKKENQIELILSGMFIHSFNALMIIWGVNQGWAYPILMVIIPGYVALGLLAFAFDWLPHHPHAVQQKYLDTRIILKPGLSTILVSQNMHLIHHLYAGIPFYHYGSALKVMKAMLKSKGAPISE